MYYLYIWDKFVLSLKQNRDSQPLLISSGFTMEHNQQFLLKRALEPSNQKPI